MPDLEHVLQVLAPHYRLAMATNRGGTAAGVVREFDLGRWLSLTVGANDVARAKPHPDMLLPLPGALPRAGDRGGLRRRLRHRPPGRARRQRSLHRLRPDGARPSTACTRCASCPQCWRGSGEKAEIEERQKAKGKMRKSDATALTAFTAFCRFA